MAIYYEGLNMVIVVLMGRSGCGKSTNEKLLEELGYSRIISYTTRPMRAGEENHREYHFVSVKATDMEIALENIPTLIIVEDDNNEMSAVEICQKIRNNEDNNISDLNPIKDLRNLGYIKFEHNRIKDISKKQGDYSKKITELESLKQEVSSNIARAIINRRINHERAKIQRLRGAKNLISDVQKAMMLPKHAVDRYRLRKYSKRQGNVNYYNNKVSVVEAKKNTAMSRRRRFATQAR